MNLPARPVWTTVAVGLILVFAGCAASPEKHDPNEVESLSTRQGRYVVFYKSSSSNAALKAAAVHEKKRKNVLANDTNDSASGGGSTSQENDEGQAPDTMENDSTPGFEQFDDEYESTESKEKREIYDPLEGYNRFMFQVNDGFYTYVLKPTAQGWRFIGPEPVRQALDRAFENVFFPVRFVNSVLQAEFEGAGRELGRFTVNSTIGLAGLFDPAKHWIGWQPNKEDFGQTLGTWGVGPGFPLVLPIFGPSNLRDTGGMIPDGYLNPVSYIEPIGLQLAVRAFYRINFSSLRVIGVYDRQKKEALDPYTFFRDMYRQNRISEIKK